MRYGKPPSHERALSGRDISDGRPSNPLRPNDQIQVVTVADEIICVYKVRRMPNDHSG